MKKRFLFLVISSFLGLSSVFSQNWIKQLTHSTSLKGDISTPTYDGGTVLCGSVQSSGSNDDIFAAKLNSAGDIVWQYKYGSANDIDGYTIQELSDHGFLIQGRMNAPLDWVVVRLDSIGQIVWSKVIGGSGSQGSGYYSKVIETSEGHLLINMYEPFDYGGFKHHCLTVMLNADGTTRWKRKYGASGKDVFFHSGLEVDAGEYLLYGWMWDLTYNKEWNMIITRIDSLGNVMNTRHFLRSGQNKRETITELKQKSNGNILISGSVRSNGWSYGWGYLAELDADFNPLWARRYGTSSTSTGIADFQMIGDEIFAVGSTNEVGNGGTDALFMKTDSVGNIIWQNVYGGAGADAFNFIDTVDQNTFWLSGYLNGTANPTIMQLDENQLLCISGTGAVTTDTLNLSYSTFTVGHPVASNPVDTIVFTRAILAMTTFDPCVVLSGHEAELFAKVENDIVKLEVISSLAEGKYELERSQYRDHWEVIEQGEWEVGAAEFSLTDKQPIQGTQFYRLKQTTLNGQSFYSNQVEIFMEAKQSFRILSNKIPTLDYSLTKPMNLNWVMLDIHGRKIANGSLGSQEVGNYQTNLPANNLAHGIYIFQIFDKKELVTAIKWMKRI